MLLRAPCCMHMQAQTQSKASPTQHCMQQSGALLGTHHHSSNTSRKAQAQPHHAVTWHSYLPPQDPERHMCKPHIDVHPYPPPHVSAKPLSPCAAYKGTVQPQCPKGVTCCTPQSEESRRQFCVLLTRASRGYSRARPHPGCAHWVSEDNAACVSSTAQQTRKPTHHNEQSKHSAPHGTNQQRITVAGQVRPQTTTECRLLAAVPTISVPIT